LPGHINDFSIKGRVIIAYGLTAKLVVLTVSTGLGSFVSESGDKVVELYRLGEIMQAVFHVGSTY
jgi:hypothetical protein